MDGVADEFLAGALSEEKQFKPQGRGAIWSSHQSSNGENSQILPLPFIIKPHHTAASPNKGPDMSGSALAIGSPLTWRQASG